MADDGSGPVVVKTLGDSVAIRALADAAPPNKPFRVPARFDETARRWVFGGRADA